MPYQRGLYVKKFVLLFLFFGLFSTTAVYALVNINTASVDELKELPGISEEEAERIVEYRSTIGPFSSASQLLRVKGIGKKTYEKIKDEITVDSLPPTSGGIFSTPAGEETKTDQKTAEEILAMFDNEPTIYDVQKAALRHSRIKPDDIDRWRRNVRLQALFPETKFKVDWYTRENSTYRTSQNIDFRDNPDRYVRGPDEYTIYNYDYDYVKYQLQFAWDVDELVYNKEELRVRGESEDLIDFKNKVVEDVTKLYYDRRRLQISMITTPRMDARSQIEKELRIDELTSMLDMMTGGFFSENIKEKAPETE